MKCVINKGPKCCNHQAIRSSVQEGLSSLAVRLSGFDVNWRAGRDTMAIKRDFSEEWAILKSLRQQLVSSVEEESARVQ